LAVWSRELNAAEVLKHYEVWWKDGNPQTAAGDGCIGLYRFQEAGGTFARNQIAGGADLFIPNRYEIQDQAFLLPFWEEASTYWIHWRSVCENVFGLVPLGFLFYAWFQSFTSPRRAAWMATLTGTLVSVTIEVVQGFLPTRYSGTTDIFTNTLGAWLGVVLYRSAARWLRPKLANGTQNGEELRQHSNVGSV
jgi:VanZ family protein